MLSINKHGIRKIKINVLNIISSVLQNLIIKNQRKSHQRTTVCLRKMKFPPAPPLAELCRNIVSGFCDDTSPDVFEKAGCAVCGKLTPIYELKECSEVEN